MYQPLRIFFLFICLCLSLSVLGQKKPFEGVLDYKVPDLNKADAYKNSKIYFSNKKLLLDSVIIGENYYKIIYDPNTLNIYAVSYADAGKKGYNCTQNEFLESFKKYIIREEGSLESIDTAARLKQITKKPKGKKVAGLDTKEVDIMATSGNETDTLRAYLYVCNSLDIRLQDYEGIFQQAFNISKANTLLFSGVFNSIKDGMPAMVDFSFENKRITVVELMKVEKTNKYNAMFDISKCKFEKNSDFFFGEE